MHPLFPYFARYFSIFLAANAMLEFIFGRNQMIEIENDTCDCNFYLYTSIVITATCPALQIFFVNAKYRSTGDLLLEILLLRIPSS